MIVGSKNNSNIFISANTVKNNCKNKNKQINIKINYKGGMDKIFHKYGNGFHKPFTIRQEHVFFIENKRLSWNPPHREDEGTTLLGLGGL